MENTEYTRPELVLVGMAESLVLGNSGPSMDDPGIPHTSHGSALEFED
jgi:hypothetical protein